MMSLHRAGQTLQRHLGNVIANKKLDAGDVILKWSAAPAPIDGNLEGDYQAPVPMQETVSALIHFVQIRSIMRGFTEFQAGDAIVTFYGQKVLSDRRDLTFILPPAGEEYVQAQVGKKVTEFWDVVIGGQPIGTTILLRKRA